MSFSTMVKNELCRLESGNNCCLLSEIFAVIIMNGSIKATGNDGFSLKIVTENAAFARKLFSSLRKLLNVYPEVIIRKSKKLKKHTSYIIILAADKRAGKLIKNAGINIERENSGEALDFSIIQRDLLAKSCCRKAFLRGAFLAGGSISDPEKTYHLEITSRSKIIALELNKLIESFDLNAKVIRRKGNYVTYLKEGENIVDFLNVIGAHSALLELENIRILKGMRNDVNRIVNCETANLGKTINASVRQVENIKYIRDNIGFARLPENLREIAEVRLIYSDASLKELGEMLHPSLGKSGVNHRLRKLDKIAEQDRELKGEQ